MAHHLVQWSVRRYCPEILKQYIFRIPISLRRSSTSILGSLRQYTHTHIHTHIHTHTHTHTPLHIHVVSVYFSSLAWKETSCYLWAALWKSHVPRKGGLMSTASEELRPSSSHTSEFGMSLEVKSNPEIATTWPTTWLQPCKRPRARNT